MGDLIELEGTGMGEEGSAAAEEGEENGGDTPTLTMNANANEEALLSERFPPRGRIRDAYPGKGKGKADWFSMALNWRTKAWMAFWAHLLAWKDGALKMDA
jgi:hypothetical protein